LAVTRSTVESRNAPRVRAAAAVKAGRGAERFWLLVAIAIVCSAWWLVY